MASIDDEMDALLQCGREVARIAEEAIGTAEAATLLEDDPASASYHTAVRSFDHAGISQLGAYPALREALSDLCNQGDGITLAELLDAVRDMALTAPFADCCDICQQNPDYLRPGGDLSYGKPAWPHAVKREDDWLTCTYRCPRCSHIWTCGYSVHAPDFI